MSSGKEFLARAAFIAAAVYAFSVGLKMFQGSGIWAPAIPLGLVLYIAAAASLLAAFALEDPTERHPQTWIASLLLVAVVSSVGFEIDFANVSYGTDAMAFAETSAELLLEGDNPYQVSGESLDHVIQRFNVPEVSVTRTTTGETIDRLVSYPGGHVLLYTLGVAIGVDDLRWVTLVFEVAALAFIWLALSPLGRLFVPFVLLLDDNLLVHFTSGAVTDWLWVLPLVMAVLFLHRERFGYAGLALGVACAIKQQPWFVVPFAVVWVLKRLSTKEATDTARYDLTAFLSGLGVGFVLLNFPFILWSPSAWLSGVLHPIFGGLVPDGQGLSSLTSRGLLPIPGYAYTAVLGLLGVASVWAYNRWFDRLADLLWVIPPALLLVSQRSFHSYFVYWLPGALLWLDLRVNQSGEGGGRGLEERGVGDRSGVVLGASMLVLVAGVGLGTFAIGGSAPLEVRGVEAEMSGGMVTGLDVELTNRTPVEAEPVFELYWRGSPVPWTAGGNHSLGPMETATLRIEPKNGDAIPPVRVDGEGNIEVLDFRVRVNRSGDSVYSASEVVRIPLPEIFVVNPTFDFWKRESSTVQTPFGWRVTYQGGTDASRIAEPIDGARGLVLKATSTGGGSNWIEAAAIQEVASFAGCYGWFFSHSFGYARTEAGDPVAVGGLQMVQDEGTVWFVPSDVESETVTRLPDGTRLVEIPAKPGEPNAIHIDLAGHAGAVGIRLDRPGILKVFNAIHESIAAQPELTTYNLDAAECATTAGTS